MTTWRKEIIAHMAIHSETLADTIASTLTDEQMDVEFDAGFGGAEGDPFTLWTENRVYFPVTYDGAEWCGSVPRNPCDAPTGHIGGE